MTLVNHPARPCSWMARTVIQGPRVLTGRADPHIPRLMQVLTHCDWLPAHRHQGHAFCQRAAAGWPASQRVSAALVPLDPAGSIHPNPQRLFSANARHLALHTASSGLWIVNEVPRKATQCVGMWEAWSERRAARFAAATIPCWAARRVEMNSL